MWYKRFIILVICFLGTIAFSLEQEGSGIEKGNSNFCDDVKPLDEIRENDKREEILQYGLSPLHIAVLSGNLPPVAKLVDSGADVNARATRTISISQADIPGILYENMSVEKDQTPLALAVGMQRSEIVGFLIQAGANLSLMDEAGQTPLHESACFASPAITMLLIDKGANVDCRSGLNQELLAISERVKNKKNLYFEEVEETDLSKNSIGHTPLHLAAGYGHEEVVDLLLECGADINARTEVGFTPLHAAASLGRFRVTELLLQRGAEVDARTISKFTPLHLASEHGLFHRGNQEGRREVIELLIKWGANINAQDFKGRIPLHHAALTNSHYTATHLLKLGARLDIKDSEGFTALDLAKQKGHNKVGWVLQSTKLKREGKRVLQ